MKTKGDGGGGQTLVATGGLQDDQLRGDFLQKREELLNALLVVGEREGFSLGQEAHVEVLLESRCQHGVLVLEWDSLYG